MGEQELRAVLGKNVKFLRFHRQLSQADLAEKARISITFLSNIERGNNFPKAGTLCNLAKALGVEVYELFKPETVPDAGKEAVERLTDDVKRRVNQTLDEIFRQYRG
jgi:transcriptional regulator with XRE-family HTH domain